MEKTLTPLYSSSRPTPSCTLWCRVIDNFGDAGVAWRLAKSLSQSFHWRVRLLVDNVATLAAFVPECPKDAVSTVVSGVRIERWTEESGRAEARRVPDVTIETFSCRLPDEVEEGIAARFEENRPTFVFALDYLTAERYAEESNGLISRHPRWGYPKTFLFPGFSSKTAGIVREEDVEALRLRFTQENRRSFLTTYGADPDAPFTLFLFTYPVNPVADLARALAADPRPAQVLLAPGEASRQFKTALGRLAAPQVQTVDLPMLPQIDFDQVLMASDACLVRGEDSTVRVQLAGVPLLWTLYPQTEETHLVKFRAFGALYGALLPEPARKSWFTLEEGLNASGFAPEHWTAWRDALPQLREGAQKWRQTLLSQSSAPRTIARIVQEKLQY